ncbi:hypothetical protein [Archangium sp.]|uniref:hypothetical protein n=1 Tax=Archangium sp. TaxID=1872627 RepID=UPI002D3352B4|nr:hypothetical protein [Archangium sp.]HYO55480.1 hypothetical protein [Archangium sp.]
MKPPLLVLFGLFLPSCMLFHKVPRSIHAPPEEGAKLERPLEVPKRGAIHIQGNMVAAIQLAMDHFRPRGTQPSPEELERRDACEFQRESYDVTAVPGPEGVMLVRFTVNQEVCPLTKVGVNVATGQADVDMLTYAVDIRTWRILSIETEPLRLTQPASQKTEGP